MTVDDSGDFFINILVLQGFQKYHAFALPISPEIFHFPIRATTPLVSALSHYLNINKTLTLLKI
ncbi:hypothetical protein [Nostoc sp.]|uniref:hypothetical protein n=1 Tax=Nostoc sp. TaxID=1180 RepID=UPI002FF94B16